MMNKNTRFLCDEMLRGLARWLRAAGYDVLIANKGENDRALLEQAKMQQRVLLTRDRKLMEIKQARDVAVLLECNAISTCVAELNNRFSIDWLRAPFTRCLLCNTTIELVKNRSKFEVPPDIKENEPLYYCPVCHKLYWEGGHVKRMRRQLERFAHSEAP